MQSDQILASNTSYKSYPTPNKLTIQIMYRNIHFIHYELKYYSEFTISNFAIIELEDHKRKLPPVFK